MVTIKTGSIKSAVGVPKDRWTNIVSDWVRISAIGFPEDCRGLLQMREECEQLGMHEELGYSSVDEFFREALFLNPETVNLACKALEISDPATVIGLEDAADLSRFERNAEIHRLREVGMTQQAIADEVGTSQPTVNDVLSGKQSKTEKPDKENRTDNNSRTLYIPKSPQDAATKIREKFGDEFATLLKEEL